MTFPSVNIHFAAKPVMSCMNGDSTFCQSSAIWAGRMAAAVSLFFFDFRANMANSQGEGVWISLRIDQDVFELFVIDVSVPDKILS